MGASELAEQPPREDARCPECGGDPLPDSVKHNLSDLGYLHDDQQYRCVDCGNQWTAGVPIGEFDRPEMADDLRCGSCGEWMFVHRVQAGRGNARVTLHLKCPAEECVNFDRATRTPDDSGVALVGYPQITGQTEGAQPYGYQED